MGIICLHERMEGVGTSTHVSNKIRANFEDKGRQRGGGTCITRVDWAPRPSSIIFATWISRSLIGQGKIDHIPLLESPACLSIKALDRG